MIARGTNGVHITEIALHTGNSHSPAHNERLSLTHFDGKLCLLGITEDPPPSHAHAITGVTPLSDAGGRGSDLAVNGQVLPEVLPDRRDPW